LQNGQTVIVAQNVENEIVNLNDPVVHTESIVVLLTKVLSFTFEVGVTACILIR
jgi:hypothetical protein